MGYTRQSSPRGTSFSVVSLSEYYDKGWRRFDYDDHLAEWVQHALPFARAAVSAHANAQWLRCGGTWFNGVNVLPNNPAGEVGDSGPLLGSTIEFIREELGLADFAWDNAQISVCYPDYPQPMPQESRSAFRYRRDRDAAHVDGLLPEGPRRRRHLREHHRFILGLPLVDFDAGAAPFVIWEGSHGIIRSALKERFDQLPPQRWGDEDVTETYHRARQQVFDECNRVEISVRPGEAYIAHRLAVHGVAPWAASAAAGGDGRMICYFRPNLGDPVTWLNAR